MTAYERRFTFGRSQLLRFAKDIAAGMEVRRRVEFDLWLKTPVQIERIHATQLERKIWNFIKLGFLEGASRAVELSVARRSPPHGIPSHARRSGLMMNYIDPINSTFLRLG